MIQSILSVDDEPHMLKLLERIISEKTPYRIHTTSNSLEVPDLLAENRYDLILSDLKMPGMDGLDILRYVKENKRFEEVIMITAFGSLETAIEALSLGVFDYITKPFKKEQILYTIKRAMRWQKMKRESQTMDKVFRLEPFTEALSAFEKEYVHRLSERCEGDGEAMAERSGIPVEKITSLTTEADPD
jgi:DNA-binding NtrC family response regulator